MTPDAPASVDSAPRSRLALGLLVLGGLMLVGGLYQVASTFLSARPTATDVWAVPPRPDWPGEGAGSTLRTGLSEAQVADIRKLYEEANQLADQHAARAGQASRWSRYADWLAFALSSLIMMLAGYFGRLPESGSDATAVAHVVQTAEEKKTRKRGPRAKGPLPRSRFAVAVGVAAGLAATGSGASDRLRSTAEQRLNSAKAVGEAVVKTTQAVANPRDEVELLEALATLRQTMRSHPL